jgi:hypothetical protein
MEESNLHTEQRRIFQEMTPERKLEIAVMLYRSARELKAAALRARHTDLHENEIQEKLKEAFLYARNGLLEHFPCPSFTARRGREKGSHLIFIPALRLLAVCHCYREKG